MSGPHATPSLVERFPALRILDNATRRRKSIPFIQQMQVGDCGAACLAMVLRHHGRDVGMERVRDALGVGRDGVNALQILQAAQEYGMRGRAVRLELDALRILPPASILHWDMSHFVVLERATSRGIWVLDPALGRRFLPSQEVSRHFTGVALELRPAGEFVNAARKDKGVWQYARLLLSHGRILRRVGVMSLLLQGLAMAVPLFTGALIDQVIPNSDYGLLIGLTLGMVALTAFGFLTSMVRGELMLQLRAELDVMMCLDFVEHLLRLPLPFFETRKTGDLMMRLSSTVSIREILTSSTATVVLDSLLVLGYLVLLFIVHPIMGLLVLALVAARGVVFLVVRHANGQLLAEHLQAYAASSSYQVQMLQGIETLKGAGAEGLAVHRWSQLFAEQMNNSVKRERLNMTGEALLKALAIASPTVVLAYGGVLVMHHQISLGTMLAVSALVAGVLLPLNTLISSAMQLQMLGSYVERVEDVLQAPVEQAQKLSRQTPRIHGALRMDSVAFRYGPHTPLVIRDVSVSIEAGQMVAIVGRSGSGKSTLARLLMGLYEPSAGRVYVDEVPLVECDLAAIRRQIGFVPQTPHFFDLSIRDNISLGNPDATLDEVQSAARLACIHGDIEGMPLGYNTFLASSGGTISGGQRQRIALARALLSHPAVILLDEATSHLDGATEGALLKNLAGLTCTRVIIAHRLSTIAKADWIFVMEEGRIVEQGTHRGLMDRAGVYAGLVESQTQ